MMIVGVHDDGDAQMLRLRATECQKHPTTRRGRQLAVARQLPAVAGRLQGSHLPTPVVGASNRLKNAELGLGAGEVPHF